LIFNQCSPGPKIERVFQTGFDDAGTWSWMRSLLSGSRYFKNLANFDGKVEAWSSPGLISAESHWVSRAPVPTLQS
jgi:hypothetical protein